MKSLGGGAEGHYGLRTSLRFKIPKESPDDLELAVRCLAATWIIRSVKCRLTLTFHQVFTTFPILSFLFNVRLPGVWLIRMFVALNL